MRPLGVKAPSNPPGHPLAVLRLPSKRKRGILATGMKRCVVHFSASLKYCRSRIFYRGRGTMCNFCALFGSTCSCPVEKCGQLMAPLPVLESSNHCQPYTCHNLNPVSYYSVLPSGCCIQMNGDINPYSTLMVMGGRMKKLIAAPGNIYDGHSPLLPKFG